MEDGACDNLTHLLPDCIKRICWLDRPKFITNTT